ncbi:ribonuclease III [Adhaeretor mobilis]|uniref:Ribonuclease 3 n=1 Tax=Adhaeretor mobilis TaxID=1930276 RepID=A0A517MWA7_9BACT|nr:ribonuclease III [Adhaeretor mobilis]QDS99158.1 Ribonuclease 3 [Adhaeretor mobilis]
MSTRSTPELEEAVSTSPSPSTEDCSRRADLDGCQAALGYSFNDLDLLEAALTHASGVVHRLSSNERMEFLGDAILGAVVCERLFHLYPEYSEGELTKVKSVVVSRETCALLSEEMGLDQFLILGKGMASDPQIPKSVLAAVLESLIAAIYLDGGGEPAKDFILRCVDDKIEATVNSEFGGNFKSLLQQHAQREHGVTPVYELLDEKGPDHAKCFQIAAHVSKQQYVPAWGKSKKEAEQRAAQNAICDLRGEEVPHTSEASLD